MKIQINDNETMSQRSRRIVAERDEISVPVVVLDKCDDIMSEIKRIKVAIGSRYDVSSTSPKAPWNKTGVRVWRAVLNRKAWAATSPDALISQIVRGV